MKYLIVVTVFTVGLFSGSFYSTGHCAEPTIKSAPDVVIYDGVYPGWPWISAGKDGTLYCVLREGVRHGFSAEGKIMLSVSRDHGKSWSAAKVIIDEPGVDDRNVAITELKNGKLLLVYNTYTAEKKSQTFGCFSSDGGQTWSARKPIGPAESRTRAAVVELSDGSLLLPFYKAPGNGSLAARSQDGGRSWKTVSISGAEGFTGDEWDVLEIAPGRILGIIRNNNRSGKMFHILWKTESQDYGKTWATPQPTNIECKRHTAPPHLAMQQGRPTLFYPDDRMVSNSAVTSNDPRFLKWNLENRLPLYQYNADRSVIPDGSYLSSVPLTKNRRLVVDYEIRKGNQRITGYFIDFPKDWGTK